MKTFETHTLEYVYLSEVLPHEINAEFFDFCMENSLDDQVPGDSYSFALNRASDILRAVEDDFVDWIRDNTLEYTASKIELAGMFIQNLKHIRDNQGDALINLA